MCTYDRYPGKRAEIKRNDNGDVSRHQPFFAIYYFFNLNMSMKTPLIDFQSDIYKGELIRVTNNTGFENRSFIIDFIRGNLGSKEPVGHGFKALGMKCLDRHCCCRCLHSLRRSSPLQEQRQQQRESQQFIPVFLR